MMVRNMVMSKMYTILPIVMRPRNVCGCTDMSKAIPPVAIVIVNQA